MPFIANRGGRLRSVLAAARAWASREPRLLAILLVHSILFAVTVGRTTPFGSLGVECTAGAVADIVLHEPRWSLWDAADSVMGGPSLAGWLGLPVFALLGVRPIVWKALALLWSIGTLLLVHAGLRRAGSPTGALLGTAGIAFLPVVAFQATLIFGDYHWTQLAFDWGTALLALHLAVSPRVRILPWVALGLLSGIGLYNSVGSAPFLAWSVLIGLAGRFRLDGPKGLVRPLVAVAAGSAPVVLPMAFRLLLHPVFGGRVGAEDPVLGRLLRLRFEWDKLVGLVWPELPWALHLQDAFPTPSLTLGWTLDLAWTWIVWVGLLACAASLLRRSAGPDDQSRVAAAIPVAFALLFIGAYAVLDSRIELVTYARSDLREHSHRVLPPLIAAMAAASGLGWARVAEGRGRVLKWSALALGMAPPAIGLFCQASLAFLAPGSIADGFAAYGGPCPASFGFFAAGRADDPAAPGALCHRLESPTRRAECMIGVALGTGYTQARVTGPDPDPDRRRDLGRGMMNPCGRLPPDLARRCDPWGPGEAPVLGEELVIACARWEQPLRATCMTGAGWFVSDLTWPDRSWPLSACDSLQELVDRDACWGGFGFQLADRLTSNPWKLRMALESMPAAVQSAAARGAGQQIGRVIVGDTAGDRVCAALGEALGGPCRAGRRDGRAEVP